MRTAYIQLNIWEKHNIYYSYFLRLEYFLQYCTVDFFNIVHEINKYKFLIQVGVEDFIIFLVRYG